MKILFVSPDASRTGVPLLLLKLIKWLLVNRSIKIDLLLLDGGPLRKDFEKLVSCYDWKDRFATTSKKTKLLRYIPFFDLEKKYQSKILKKLERNSYDILYFNSAAGLRIFDQLQKTRPSKTIVHVHELETILKLLGVTESLKSIEIDYLIAASE